MGNAKHVTENVIGVVICPNLRDFSSSICTQVLIYATRKELCLDQHIVCARLKSAKTLCLEQPEKQTHKPDFNEVVGFVAGMQEEPDFLHKVVDTGFPPGAPDVHHPLVGRLVIFFTLIWGNVPEGDR